MTEEQAKQLVRSVRVIESLLVFVVAFGLGFVADQITILF